MARGRWLFISYLTLNLVILIAVKQLTDLPIRLSNWEAKAEAFAAFTIPNDNFYPPGSSLLLVPFLWSGPDYFLAIVFYFLWASALYFAICNYLIKSPKLKRIALLGLSLNPYLLWLVVTSQDTIFELFLLLSVFALFLRGNYWLGFFPLYMLCLTRPAYWTLFIAIPLVILYLKKGVDQAKIRKWILVVPIVALIGTISLNSIAFGSTALAGESGVTAHFSHNKYYYLSMPKFDMDYFLSKGGNMDADKVISGSTKFASVEDKELRAALISVIENPKSLLMNTVQKVDSYFFAVQKNPQLPGFYYLSEDQKSIVIQDERLTWSIILGNTLYFLYRILLLISVVVAITIYLTSLKRRLAPEYKNGFLLIAPYFLGVIPGVLFYTESRFKIVSELLLIPFVGLILNKYRESKVI